MTGEPVELLWVKGSGGDLGTLTESGLAVLRLDRMRALVDVYPGVEREDEMVAAFDYCLHGKGGAAPSIDTAMHGLVDAAHVDHLHPDSGIAIATAADGEAADQGDLRRQGRVGAVAPARASSSASTSPRSRSRTRRRSAASSAATASPRGATPATRPRRLAVDHRHRRGVHRRARQAGAVRPGARGLRRAARGRAARQGRGAGADDPRPRLDRPADGRPLHRLRRRARLPGAARAPAAGRARHVVPRPLPAHQGQAAGARPAGVRLGRGVGRAAQRAARGLPRGLPGATTTATPPPTPRPSAAPTRSSCSCPASGCSATARTSRPPAWRASSTSTRST